MHKTLLALSLLPLAVLAASGRAHAGAPANGNAIEGAHMGNSTTVPVTSRSAPLWTTSSARHARLATGQASSRTSGTSDLASPSDEASRLADGAGESPGRAADDDRESATTGAPEVDGDSTLNPARSASSKSRATTHGSRASARTAGAPREARETKAKASKHVTTTKRVTRETPTKKARKKGSAAGARHS